MSDVFLAAYHGGLGDYLQFSTLAEEYYKQANRKTFIWDKAFFRNDEIFQLISTNPYIYGKKCGDWNAGDYPGMMCVPKTDSTISNWEISHGLIPTNKYPKIYYEPKLNQNLNNVVLIDVSSISINYETSKISQACKKLRSDLSDKTFLNVKFKNSINSFKGVNIAHDGKHNKYNIDSDGELEIENIFHYCDVIASSFGIVTLFSGQSVLSCAIKQYNKNLQIYCIVPSNTFLSHKEKKSFIYDNINYISV
jgi:hypothetical protein